MLDAVVFCWKDNRLNPQTSKTYRGINVKLQADEDRKLFQKNKKVMFTQFISSSTEESTAKRFSENEETGHRGAIFVFESVQSSRYKPRYIEHFSEYPGENECLFPIGAEFRVAKVEIASDAKKPDKIHLKLIN